MCLCVYFLLLLLLISLLRYIVGQHVTTSLVYIPTRTPFKILIINIVTRRVFKDWSYPNCG
jgi:hypothetical protein